MKIPAATLEFWAEAGFSPATRDEVARVAELMGRTPPADYQEFLLSHGFVEWDIDIPDTFQWRLRGEGQDVVKSSSVTHLEPVRKMESYLRHGRVDDPSRGLPQFPAEFFPIAGTAGQDAILMELAPEHGRIWYWPEREDPWGTGDNTELGFVAESFTAFIEGLRLGD